MTRDGLKDILSDVTDILTTVLEAIDDIEKKLKELDERVSKNERSIKYYGDMVI